MGVTGVSSQHIVTLSLWLNPQRAPPESKTHLGSSLYSTADSLHDLGQATSVSLSLSLPSLTSWG